jgi:hypothetical protein
VNTYPELDNLEIQKLKKKVADLELELTKARTILEENDLLDDIPEISDTEALCINEIHKLRLASDSGILTLEDVKILDILVKNLMVVRGKSVPDDKSGKKKGAKSVAELLSIVGNKK